MNFVYESRVLLVTLWQYSWLIFKHANRWLSRQQTLQYNTLWSTDPRMSLKTSGTWRTHGNYQATLLARAGGPAGQQPYSFENMELANTVENRVYPQGQKRSKSNLVCLWPNCLWWCSSRAWKKLCLDRHTAADNAGLLPLWRPLCHEHNWCRW